MEMYRDTNNKLIAGVCAGIAERFGWNVNLVRLAAIASLALPGPQLILYLLLWVILPAE